MGSITPHIPYRLDGKVALVTGSGRGIGAAMAVELGRCGAKVVVNYANSRESAEKIVAQIQELGSEAVVSIFSFFRGKEKKKKKVRAC